MSAKTDKILAKLHKDLGVKGSLEEFKKGILVEVEHTSKETLADGRFAVIPYKLEQIAKIAAIHLEELPNYYTLLGKMEQSGKKAHNLKDQIMREDDTCDSEFDPVGDPLNHVLRPEMHTAPNPYQGAAEKDSGKKSKINKVRETLGEFLAIVNNQIIPDSKKNPKDFEAWKNIRELVKDLAISLDDVSK